jgi:hypothetical protein
MNQRLMQAVALDAVFSMVASERPAMVEELRGQVSNNALRVFCFDDHIDLRLRQEIEAVLAASLDLRNAFLSAFAFDVRNRHSRAELSLKLRLV